MATKRKIGVSLRESVSAEKQKVVDSKSIRAKSIVGDSLLIKAEPAKLDTVAKKNTSKPINQKSIIEEASTQNQTVVNKINNEKLTNKDISSNNSYFNTLSGINGTLEHLTTISDKLTSLFLESLRSTNEQVTEYLQQLSTINSPTGLYDINIQFINKLKASQQEVFARNMDILSKLKKVDK